ncbi:MAG: FAD-dependent oxidoreductase [Bacteroidales bacterium]|nr:FAD-dependent oxidoreductase [Bacteroidales bacterium]
MNPEATRCLLCKNARCTAACPVGTDVPSAMKLYREGKLSEAGKLLFENNPMSAITSCVCDWPRMCYGHCILNAKNAPIKWYEIEQELSRKYLLEEVSLAPGAPAGKSVAIIGAGPAGICAALWLAQKGVKVDLYDSFPEVGGVLKYGIPDFRLDKKLVDAYAGILKGLGVAFHGGKTLGKDLILASVKDNHDAILLAAGAWIAREMRIPGEDNPHVVHALDFLTEPDKFALGHKVIVVGGGNVAMDACRTAIRKGCDTTVVYRKTFENMPAGSIEIREAQEEGVKFDVFKVPVEVRTDGSRTYAIVRDCENYTREDGSLATRILDGTDAEMDFDTMIVAVSESADKSLMEGAPEGVFTAGDYAYGPKTVVAAVQSAKEVTADILSYLGLS